ncbi:MAG: glycosyltransferase [Betaproteobacteria bacterium]|nr:glycosyltransferase [Betaproteobacteria bacterium]
MDRYFRPMRIEHYEDLIGPEALERIILKARRLHDLRVINISSTFYGGGVAEILSSLTLLQRALGIRADWRLIQGSPDFFSITKKLHNALQGGDINLSELKKEIYEGINLHNALRMDVEADIVVVHDPQPLPLITHFRHTCPWIWRCHVDLSRPDPDAWAYLREFVDDYDAMVVSLPEYKREVHIPQLFFMPALDPFSIKNREMSDAEINDRLRHYGIPEDLPIVAQISRFDRWKDPEGVIEAFRMARKEVDATLVLLGNVATDDPEGQEVFESLLDCKEERILILTAEDSALVNALQRRAAVILQKSLREGFGLTVTEAMWKGTAVIGGDCGGIRHQVEDGRNGFLVSTVEEAAKRIAQLVGDADLRRRLGTAARDTVREKFLMSRLAEQYLDLFESFEPRFTLNHRRGARLEIATPAARR